MLENGMDWYKGDDYITVYISHGKWKTQMEKLLKSDPDKINITYVNTDGTYLAQIPAKWVNIRKPKQIEMSEERKKELADRLRGLRVKNDGYAES